MKILLVYPKCSDTFWNFKYALSFISKKAVTPPLGLLTVAAMLPSNWEKRVIDMNVTTLDNEDLKWADFVFISAMSTQRNSVKEIISECRKLNLKIVAGGPLFTVGYDEFEGIDHLILGEAEVTLPLFLEDLKRGCLKQIYTSNQRADIKKTPIPLWELIDMRKYSMMSIQVTRGCPFSCEFCNVSLFYGHTPRTKDKDQIIEELETLYSHNWRGRIFVVDENFIGNKEKLKTKILPAMVEWMRKRRYPFQFTTQISINLSDDEEFMQLMVKAGFDTVFVGIETPNEESLTECNKRHNKNRNLVACVKKIQSSGLQVQGGFIVGFDSDPPSIFETQIEFIQKAKIVLAKVELLDLYRAQGTKLYHRLKKENRLLKFNDTELLNFVPKMNSTVLISGYKHILSTIYSSKCYYKRVAGFLKEYKLFRGFQFSFSSIKAFLKSIYFLGIVEKERFYYWKFISWTIFRYPQKLHLAITFAIYGFHARKMLENMGN